MFFLLGFSIKFYFLLEMPICTYLQAVLHVLSVHLQPKQVGKINHFTYFHLYIPSSMPFLCVVSVNMYRYRGTQISLVHACGSKRLTLGLLQLDSTFMH